MKPSPKLLESARLFARIAATGPVALYLLTQSRMVLFSCLIADASFLWLGHWPAVLALHIALGALMAWDMYHLPTPSKEPLRITKQ